jgi:hypothetical protein
MQEKRPRSTTGHIIDHEQHEFSSMPLTCHPTWSTWSAASQCCHWACAGSFKTIKMHLTCVTCVSCQ